MATINHKTYNEATETFKDFNVYDGKETLIFKVDGADQTVYASNNIGIGNIPSNAFEGYKLQIGSISDSQTFLSIGNSSSGVGPLNGLVIGCDSTGADIYQRENQPLRLHTNNSERMRLDGSVLQLTTAASNQAVIQLSNSSSYQVRGGSNYGYLSLVGPILRFDANGSERMRITSAGLVGIGTSSPIGKLQVEGVSSGQGIRLNHSASNSFIYSTISNGDPIAFDNLLGNLAIYTAGGERMRITSAGDVWLKGASTSTGYEGAFENTEADFRIFASRYGGTGKNLQFWPTGASEAMRITSAGNVGIGTTSPDTLVTLGNINSTDNSVAIKMFRGGATASYATYGFAGNAVINSVGGDLVIQRETSERARFTSDGLCFNGDYLAANALDDYEEGTWTPTFIAPTNLSNPLDVDGKYTKIGNVVNLNLAMEWDIASSSAESNVQITLPFTAYSTANKSVGHVSFFVGGGADRFGVGSLFLGTTSNSVVNMYIAANQTNATGTAEFRASYTYFVS